MKATLNWIKELCPADLDTDSLCAALMRVGFEIEDIEHHSDDTAIELEITANHAEWMSVAGIAREVAAVTDTEAKLPPCSFAEGEEAAEQLTSVEVLDEELCPYYGARVIRGVNVETSPSWIQRRLELIGLRPVNNVADITNLVMYETGQPLHAFDYNKLAENRIVVRRARRGEKMIAINDKELTLKEEQLVIADAEKPVALAGVMGGANSEITEYTTDILLECAAFNGPNIRRTTRSTGLTSDSSARFERGTDVANADYASRRATAMILQMCGGTAAKGVVEVKAPLSERKEITLRHDRVDKILGMSTDRERTASALEKLGFEITNSDSDRLTVLTPSWRKDVSREIDLIEEVARLNGYDAIPRDITVKVYADPTSSVWEHKKRLRDIMAGIGLDEAVSAPFVSEKVAKLVDYWGTDFLALRNPPRSDQNAMRTSLLPSLVEAVKGNHDRSIRDVELFGVEAVYRKAAEDDGAREHQVICAVSDGGLFEFKGVVEAALKNFTRNTTVGFKPFSASYLADGTGLTVTLDEKEVGYFGQISDKVLSALDMKTALIGFEADLALLCKHAELELRSFDDSRIPRYPSTERDFAFVVDEGVQWADVENAVRSACEDAPLESVEFFDIYRGKQIPAGKKSVALRVVFRSGEGTLTEEAVRPFEDAITRRMNKDFSAKLRG